MTNSCSSVDFPDSINIESVIFDEQKNVIFGVLFSMGYLALSMQTNYLSGVLALLSPCVGYIIPGPKA